MSSITLHSTPQYSAVVREQLRSVGLALRKEGVFFLGFLCLIGVLTIASAMRMASHIHTGNYCFNPMSGFTWLLIPFGFVGMLLPFGLAGMLVPFGVWRSEDPSRRAYHWSMPIARGQHTLTKTLAGWIWLMVALTIYLAFVLGLLIVVSHIIACTIDTSSQVTMRDFIIPIILPFTATNIIYLLTSAIVIGSNNPWRWIGRGVTAYIIALCCFQVLGFHEVTVALGKVITGDYGLSQALFGGLVGHTQGQAIMVVSDAASMTGGKMMLWSWIRAVLVWTIGSGLAVCLAAYRRRDA